jgi:hypothetical protein
MARTKRVPESKSLHEMSHTKTRSSMRSKRAIADTSCVPGSTRPMHAMLREGHMLYSRVSIPHDLHRIAPHHNVRGTIMTVAFYLFWNVF